ncbi:MAG: hypothetical protein P1U58_11300 [Verrucomicrobiales bacterium]|nr:hypothetical protein [Verrucomicrobiales bacterium]
MKKVVFLSLIGLVSYSPYFVNSSEYGGKWTDEGIREYSLRYIENTKERFAQRALRLSEVIDFPILVSYRPLTENQQEVYEKFLADRISDGDRERLFRLLLSILEEARVELAEAENRAYPLWEKLPKEEREKLTSVTAEVYGTELVATNLGVVLDNSPSMLPYLEQVRAEVGKSFPLAHFREAAGSGLHQRGFYESGEYLTVDDSWFYGQLSLSESNPFDSKWHQSKIYERFQPHYRQVKLERDPLAALMGLITLQGVDTIYWFCDFEDDIEDEALEMLATAIEDYEVKFYVHSSNRRPDRDLVEVIEKSEGEVIRKRIR